MTSPGKSGLRVRSVGGVLEVVIGPYSIRNALGTQACQELGRVFDPNPPAERKCYLLLGDGETFCSGADLRDLTSAADADRLQAAMTDLFFRMHKQPLPIVCWINGQAIGGGAILALLCDIRLAAQSTRILIPAMRRGIAIDPRLVRMLADQVGRGAAAKLLLTGTQVAGADLMTFGYVHDVVHEHAAALALASSVAELGGWAVQSHRRALQANMDAAHDLYIAAQEGPARASTIAAFGEQIQGS